MGDDAMNMSRLFDVYDKFCNIVFDADIEYSIIFEVYFYLAI